MPRTRAVTCWTAGAWRAAPRGACADQRHLSTGKTRCVSLRIRRCCGVRSLVLFCTQVVRCFSFSQLLSAIATKSPDLSTGCVRTSVGFSGDDDSGVISGYLWWGVHELWSEGLMEMGWMRVVNGEPPAHDVIQRPAVQQVFYLFSILTFVVLCVATRLPLLNLNTYFIFFPSSSLFVLAVSHVPLSTLGPWSRT